MTTKILTIRVPSTIYSTLCAEAGEIGVPVSSHVRRIIEREHDAEQLARLRTELLTKLDSLATPAAQTNTNDEVLLLCRAIATHLQPQLVAQVRAKMAQANGSVA